MLSAPAVGSERAAVWKERRKEGAAENAHATDRASMEKTSDRETAADTDRQARISLHSRLRFEFREGSGNQNALDDFTPSKF